METYEIKSEVIAPGKHIHADATESTEKRLLDHEYVEAKYKDDKTETIVLIHGFGGNHRIWKHQMEIFSRYYNVLSIDLPSHNDGNIKLSEMEVSLKAVCDRIIDVVDGYNIYHALFMGVSLGTIFVKCLEVYYPSYVDLGVLVGTMATVNIILRSCVEVFSKIGDKLPFNTVYYIFSKIIMPRPDSKKSREIFRQCAKALNQKEFKLYMKLFKQAFRFNDKFKNTIHKENIYITGADDICFKHGVFKEVLDTHGRLMVFEHCGHVCNIDKKEKFNYIIGRMLKHRMDSQRVFS